MAITSYSELLAAIADWMVRSNLTRAADCVRFFEEEFNGELRLRPMMKRATNAAISSEYESLPADFLREISLAIVDGRPLKPATVEQLDEWAAEGPVSDQPSHYAIVGSSIRYWPAPSAPHTGKLTYFQAVPVLSDAAPTNWLLSVASSVYLYGSLRHAAPYLRDEAAEATFERRYKAALGALRAASRERGGELRTELADLLSRNRDLQTGYP